MEDYNEKGMTDKAYKMTGIVNNLPATEGLGVFSRALSIVFLELKAENPEISASLVKGLMEAMSNLVVGTFKKNEELAVQSNKQNQEK